MEKKLLGTSGMSCCMCGAWRLLGESLHALCEPGPPEEEPGHARLQRMHEEREREMAEAQKQALEYAAAQERRARDWQAELAVLAERRAGMEGEELDQDCIAHFATFELLSTNQVPTLQMPCTVGNEVVSVEKAENGSETIIADSRHKENAGPRWPDESFGNWLKERFGSEKAHGTTFESGSLCWSFGELPKAACSGIAQSLVDVLAVSAAEADAAAAEASGVQEAVVEDFTQALDLLLEKYATDAVVDKTTNTAGLVAQDSTIIKKHQARATWYRTMHQRVTSLLPCLADDIASTRLVAALAVLDFRNSDEPGESDGGIREFHPPICALSTADMCWALCSEKRHLIIERMIPGDIAKGCWSWREVRQTGLGWWMCGAATAEQLDSIVTKLAQAAVAQLRRQKKDLEKKSGADWLIGQDLDPDKSVQRLADEAFFWYVLLGTQISKLRALLKTGVLSGDPALVAMLTHERSSEREFLRKNAFRLLEIHRFHLAASLFLLSDGLEEAARVVAGHMHDLQLMLILARRRPDIAAPLLRDSLDESTFCSYDPWLRFLLSWHAGDTAAARCAFDPQLMDNSDYRRDLASPVLFDGTLQLSSVCDGLVEVAQVLCGQCVP